MQITIAGLHWWTTVQARTLTLALSLAQAFTDIRTFSSHYPLQKMSSFVMTSGGGVPLLNEDLHCTKFTVCAIVECVDVRITECRGVQIAKNDFGSVFGSVLQKTAVFGWVLVLLN